MPGHVLMSEIEIITNGGRRRRWSVSEKMRIVEETLDWAAGATRIRVSDAAGPVDDAIVRVKGEWLGAEVPMYIDGAEVLGLRGILLDSNVSQAAARWCQERQEGGQEIQTQIDCLYRNDEGQLVGCNQQRSWVDEKILKHRESLGRDFSGCLWLGDQVDASRIESVPFNEPPIAAAPQLDEIVGADDHQPPIWGQPDSTHGTNLRPAVNDATVHVEDQRHTATVERQIVSGFGGLRVALLVGELLVGVHGRGPLGRFPCVPSGPRRGPEGPCRSRAKALVKSSLIRSAEISGMRNDGNASPIH